MANPNAIEMFLSDILKKSTIVEHKRDSFVFKVGISNKLFEENGLYLALLKKAKVELGKSKFKDDYISADTKRVYKDYFYIISLFKPIKREYFNYRGIYKQTDVLLSREQIFDDLLNKLQKKVNIEFNLGADSSDTVLLFFQLEENY